MSTHVPRSFLVVLRVIAVLMTSVVAFCAVVGGIALVADPSGSVMRVDLALLHGTPFTDFRVPGFLLLFVVGGVAVRAVSKQASPRAGTWTIGAGATLFWWMFVQMLLVSARVPMQKPTFYFAFAMQLVGLLVNLLGHDPAPESTEMAAQTSAHALRAA